MKIVNNSSVEAKRQRPDNDLTPAVIGDVSLISAAVQAVFHNPKCVENIFFQMRDEKCVKIFDISKFSKISSYIRKELNERFCQLLLTNLKSSPFLKNTLKSLETTSSVKPSILLKNLNDNLIDEFSPAAAMATRTFGLSLNRFMTIEKMIYDDALCILWRVIKPEDIDEEFDNAHETFTAVQIRNWMNNNQEFLNSWHDYLSLKELSLKCIPPEISKFTKLKTFDLSSNRINVIPVEIAGLEEIQSLILDGNHIYEIPPEIGNLTDLQKLSLNRNFISKLPSEIANLANLKILKLDDNNIEEIPPEIERLQLLNTLSISGNKIKELPSEIASLELLEKLNLNNNKIEQIPPAIGSLTNLQKLYLDKNKIKELPSEIESLKSLVSLSLSSNKIDVFPSVIEKLTALRYLYLNDNKVTVRASDLGAIAQNIVELQCLKRIVPVVTPKSNVTSVGGYDYDFNGMDDFDFNGMQS